MAKVPGRRGDLRERDGDVVLVPAEEARLAVEVQLGADAVVLVLDPGLVADPPHHLVRVGHRGRQHEADGATQVQGRAAQRVVASQGRGLARLTDQHQRATHVRDGAREGGRHRLLQQPFAQPDPHLARRDPRDEARLLRRCTAQQAGHLGHAGIGAGGIAHGAEGTVHRGHRQPPPGRLAAGQQVGGGIAQVGVTQVGGVQGGGIGAGGGGQRLALLHPAQAQPVLGPRQRTAGEEGGGCRDVVLRQAAQVLGQQVPLAQL